MRWIKLHGNMLTDKRLLRLQKELKLSGLGLYFSILNQVECIGEGALHIDQIVGAINGRTSRKKILEIIMQYDLFLITDYGLVFSLDPLPGYTPDELTELRLTDAPQPCDRPRAQIVPECEDKTKEDKTRTDARFHRPSVAEVMAYCIERHNNVDPQHFVDFYEARGWKYGNTRITDWKACVRTWERRRSRGFNDDDTLHYDNDNSINHGSTMLTTSAPSTIKHHDGPPIPDDAPPRPSPRAQWDFATNSWNEFY